MKLLQGFITHYRNSSGENKQITFYKTRFYEQKKKNLSFIKWTKNRENEKRHTQTNNLNNYRNEMKEKFITNEKK